MKEGQKLIADMLKKTGKENWTWKDLYQYMDDGYFDITLDGQVRIDGWYDIAKLEAILVAMYHERGAMRG